MQYNQLSAILQQFREPEQSKSLLPGFTSNVQPNRAPILYHFGTKQYSCTFEHKKTIDRLTISSHEFRANQHHYLDQVAQGIELLITRKTDAFKVTRVEKDDTLMTKEEFYAMIERAKEQAKQGLGYTMDPGESLTDFMKRMRAESHI